MKESTHVYELLRRNMPEVHWQRIENVAGTGVPDVNGCLDGIEFWIECKIGKAGSFEIRPDQIAWHTKRVNKGGRCFVVVREDSTMRVYKSDGKGGWIIVHMCGMPFNYGAMKKIFLHSPMI